MTRLDALVAAATDFLAQDRSGLSGGEAAEAVVTLAGVLNRLEGAKVELAGHVADLPAPRARSPSADLAQPDVTHVPRAAR